MTESPWVSFSFVVSWNWWHMHHSMGGKCSAQAATALSCSLTNKTPQWLTDLSLQTASQTGLHLQGMMPNTFILYFWGSLCWEVTVDILAFWCEEHGYIFWQSCIGHMGTRTHLSQVANHNMEFVRKNNLWEYPNDINIVWLNRQRP